MAIQSKHRQTATTVRAPMTYEVPAWHPTPVQCSAQKPPDMQIRLDSIYCPAECQLFPILGWLGSLFRMPRCRIQLFGWKTTTGRNVPGMGTLPTPCQDHEHQHHSHHFEPRGNYRHVLMREIFVLGIFPNRANIKHKDFWKEVPYLLIDSFSLGFFIERTPCVKTLPRFGTFLIRFFCRLR